MHAQFRIETLHQHSHDLAAQVERARLRAAAASRVRIAVEAVSFRLSGISDDRSLERLAALEGTEVPRGRQLLAEVEGEVVAALPLAGGALLGDPFRRTAHFLPLMRVRAAQVQAPSRSRRALRIFDGRFALARATTR